MEDTLLIGIFLAILAIIFVMSGSILQIGNAAYQNTSSYAPMKEQVQANNDQFPQILDGMYLGIYLAAWMAVLLFSLRINSDPAYFFVSFLFMIVVVFIMPFVANIYFDSVSTGFAAEGIQSFTIIPFILERYVFLGVIMIISIMIALYGKFSLGR